MLLPLLLALPLAWAGPSRGARLAALEAQVAQLTADNLALATQLEALQSATAGVERSLNDQRMVQQGLDSQQSETEELLGTLIDQIADLRTALKATPKKARPDQHLALLDAEVKRLDEQVRALAVQVAARPVAPAAGVNAADEDAATALYKLAMDANSSGDFARAKELIAQLLETWPTAKASSRALKLKAELDVVGARPAEPVVVQWFSDPVTVNDAPLTLVVFWEVWCPHCKREVPRLNTWDERYADRGLNIVALTRLTKSATIESVRAFVEENALRFAVGQEDGAASVAYAVSGIPAAALVQGGEVVWRGHPARVDEALLERFLPPAK